MYIYIFSYITYYISIFHLLFIISHKFKVTYNNYDPPRYNPRIAMRFVRYKVTIYSTMVKTSFQKLSIQYPPFINMFKKVGGNQQRYWYSYLWLCFRFQGQWKDWMLLSCLFHGHRLISMPLWWWLTLHKCSSTVLWCPVTLMKRCWTPCTLTRTFGQQWLPILTKKSLLSLLCTLRLGQHLLPPATVLVLEIGPCSFSITVLIIVSLSPKILSSEFL